MPFPDPSAIIPLIGVPPAIAGALAAVAAASTSSNAVTVNVIDDVGTAPAADTSWIAYSCEYEYIQENHIARHKPLAGVTTVTQPAFDLSGDVTAARTDTTPATPTARSNVPDILQRVSGPTAQIILTGYAIREGFPINPPSLLAFQGLLVVEQSRKIVNSRPKHFGGIPVNVCRWRIVYELSSVPSTIPIPGDPMLGMAGSSAAPAGLGVIGLPK
jgi:hypothetical protein